MDTNNLRFISIKELKLLQMDALHEPQLPSSCKKQKREDDIPAEPSISPQIQQIEQPINIEILANDFITLVFIEPIMETILNAEKYRYHYFKPTYTHQLFENEIIDFLDVTTQEAFIKYELNSTSDKESIVKLNQGPKLLIYIRCDNLTHCTVTTSISQTEEIKLLEHIQPALPTLSVHHHNIENQSELSGESILNASFKDILNLFPKISPPGTLLSRFKSQLLRRSKGLSSNCSSYELYLATDKDPGASELLSNAEKIATWHIETADSVDFTDERWEVLYLYNTSIDSVSNVGDNSISSSGSTSIISSESINDDVHGRYPIRNFAGYMTLFTFHNPFLGSKIRVCQVLVLPHMQGRGLGREMLLAVYRLAQTRENVTEVTVEDPCPAFERLRDAVDCEWTLLHIHQELETKGNDIKDKAENEPVILRYKEEIVEASLASTAEEKERNEILKLTVTQSIFAFESLQYAALVLSLLTHQEEESKNSEFETSINGNKTVPDIDNGCLITLLLSSSLEYKAFRLKVKRRLLNNSANKHLKNLGSSIMQVKLEELYNEMLVRYNYCLKAISRIQISS